MIREILSLKDFNEIKGKGTGYIAITDHKLKGTRGNRVHRAICYHVKAADFEKKVELNNKENGEYYFTDNVSVAIAKFQNMSECKTCL